MKAIDAYLKGGQYPMGDVEGAKGKAKEVAGSVIGDKSMEREGEAQQDKAEAQEKAAAAEERQESHES